MSDPLSPAVLAGPILSNKPGDVTIVWRDGEVIRQSPWGKLQVRRSVPAIPTPHDDQPPLPIQR